MTAGTSSRRASTGADARPPSESRSRPPVTPQRGGVKGNPILALDSCSKVGFLAVTEVSALLPLCPGSYMSSCHTVPGGGAS
jgi:hypothetical protein